MYKFVLVGTVLGMVAAGTYHPVNPTIIEEIRSNGSW